MRFKPIFLDSQNKGPLACRIFQQAGSCASCDLGIFFFFIYSKMYVAALFFLAFNSFLQATMNILLGRG